MRPQASALCNSSADAIAATGPRRLPARLPRHLRDAASRVEDGRAVKRAGRPGPSADARRAVHQGLALHRAHLPPRARAASAEARRARRAAAASSRSAGTRRSTTSPRACRRSPRATPQAIVPYSYCRHDGAGAGREHGGALLPPARRVAARPHDLLVGRRRGARRDLRRQGRHARRALRREPPDPDLGQQLDRLATCISGRYAQAAKRAGAQAGLHRPAPHRDGREVPRAHRAAARHRRRARARR